MAGQDPSPQTTLLILLGASRWPLANLDSSPAFENAKNALQAYFLSDPHGFHLPESNVLDCFNSNDTGPDILDRISDFLRDSMAMKKASSTQVRDILVYFVGHGGITKDSSIFYLAIPRTRKDYEKATGIAIDDLAERLKKGARFQRRILILDCCFAAAAVRFFQGAATTELLREKTIAAFEEKDQGIGFPGRGTSFLGSSGKDVASIILPDESSTMFTSALLSALHAGDPFQEKERLPLRTVHRLTVDFLSKTFGDSFPQPELHSPDQTEGKVEDVPFFPNPAARAARASADIVPLSVAENLPQSIIQAQPSQERSDLPSVHTQLPVVSASPTSRDQPHSSPPGALISVSKPGGKATGVLFRRGALRGRVMLLLALVFILLIGSVLLYATVTGSNTNFRATATATAAANALAAAVAADGIMFGFDAAHSHFNPYERILSPVTVPHLKQAWTAQTGSKIPSSPAVANGVVYVGSQDGKLYAFDATTGATLWRTAKTGDVINSSPAVANGVVYIGSNDGKLYAFHLPGTAS